MQYITKLLPYRFAYESMYEFSFCSAYQQQEVKSIFFYQLLCLGEVIKNKVSLKSAHLRVLPAHIQRVSYIWWQTSILNKGIIYREYLLLKQVVSKTNSTVKLTAFKKEKQALVNSALPGKKEVINSLSYFYLCPWMKAIQHVIFVLLMVKDRSLVEELITNWERWYL